MDNTLRVRVNEELLNYYKGDPDKTKEALTLYMRKQQEFLKHYEEPRK